MNRGRVNVVLRVKPLEGGRVSSNITVVDNELGGASVILKKSKKTEELFQYRFYRTLENASQQETYKVCGEEVINSCLDGYNGTIIAYGQTGSGKTHTMFGPDGVGLEDADSHGIMPRAIEHVFAAVKRCLEWKVKMTYVEIYNETFRDLLSNSRTPISIIDGTNKARGITSLKGCTPITLKSKSHAFQLLLKGQESRMVAAHAMNDRSSRSHTIVTLWIEVTADDGRMIKSKLNMVDLAGSERVKKTNASGTVAKEATYINKSLSCLSLVAKELRRKATHVRYRDSKLTHYLKDSIGGNCRTLMVACVWGNSSNFGESLSTCRFADDIQNVEVTASKTGGVESVHGKLFKMNPAMTKYIEQMMEKRVAQEKAKMFRNLKKRGLVTSETDDVDTLLDDEEDTTTLAENEKSELEVLRTKVKALELESKQNEDTEQDKKAELELLREKVEKLEAEKKAVQDEMSKQMKDAECSLLEEMQELREKVSELQELRALTHQECIELTALRERMTEVATRSLGCGMEKSYNSWHPKGPHYGLSFQNSVYQPVPMGNQSCWESVEEQARVVGELEGLRDRLKQLHDVAVEKLSTENFEELTKIRNKIIQFQQDQQSRSSSNCVNENEEVEVFSKDDNILEELEFMKNRLRALHSIPLDQLTHDHIQELTLIKNKVASLQNDDKVRSVLISREVEKSKIDEKHELGSEYACEEYVESPDLPVRSATSSSSFYSQRLSIPSEFASSITVETPDHTDSIATSINELSPQNPIAVSSGHSDRPPCASKDKSPIPPPVSHTRQLSDIPPFPGTESMRSRDVSLDSNGPASSPITSVFQSTRNPRGKSLKKRMSSQFWKLIGYSKNGFGWSSRRHERENSIDETSNIVILNSLTHDQLLELLRDRYVSHPCLGASSTPSTASDQLFDSNYQQNFALP